MVGRAGLRRGQPWGHLPARETSRATQGARVGQARLHRHRPGPGARPWPRIRARTSRRSGRRLNEFRRGADGRVARPALGPAERAALQSELRVGDTRFSGKASTWRPRSAARPVLRLAYRAVSYPFKRAYNQARAEIGLPRDRRPYGSVLFSDWLVLATGCPSLDVPRLDLPTRCTS